MHGAVDLKHQNPLQKDVLAAMPTATGRRGSLTAAGNETTQSPAWTKKTTPSWTSVMWSSRPHPFLLCGRTVNTGSPSRDRGRHFPARVCLMGCLVSLACLVEQTTRPTLHHEHHSHTQSFGERIFPSHARFFALSDRSSKSDAEHQLWPWSFGITIVRASCRPTSVKESCCDTLFA